MQRPTRAARLRALPCLFAAACVCALPSQTSAQTAGRERVSFNQGWRFKKDDPQGAEGRLAYEKIKDWVRATGGEFVAGGTKAARPEGEPGAEVAYTRRDFDDRGWRALDLPRDWGVEGPFEQECPGETGKLAWWGVGWYRKHFDVRASDRGRRILLDIDGAMSYASVRLNGRFVDLSFITVSAADAARLVVPRSKNRVRFELSGPGEIVATDNGDATSFEPFRSKQRNAYNGLCLVVVRAKAPGLITLRAHAEGLKGARAVIRGARGR